MNCAKRACCQRRENYADQRVKVFVFDFDQTLSAVHVFKQLAGWEAPSVQFVHPPFELSEKGQVALVTRLNASGQYVFTPPNQDQNTQPAIFPLDKKKGLEGTSWSVACLGGNDRVNALHRFFSDLKSQNATLVICTKGYVDTVRKILRDVDCEKYFSRFYGRSDVEYNRRGRARATGATGTPDDDMKRTKWSSKGLVLRALVEEWGLERSEAVLIDDDIRELDGSSAYSETLWVEDAAGIDPQIMMTLAEAAKNLSSPDNNIELKGFGAASDTGYVRNRSGHSFEEL